VQGLYAGLNKHNVFRNVAVQLIPFLPENLALAEIFGSAAWNYHLTMPDWKIDRQKKTRKSCWKGNEETENDTEKAGLEINAIYKKQQKNYFLKLYV
jgi:hypothetical protein